MKMVVENFIFVLDKIGLTKCQSDDGPAVVFSCQMQDRLKYILDCPTPEPDEF